MTKLEKARIDIEEGRITKDEFTEIWKQHGDYLEISLEDFLGFPLYSIDNQLEEGKLYRINDQPPTEDIAPLLKITSIDEEQTSSYIQICRII